MAYIGVIADADFVDVVIISIHIVTSDAVDNPLWPSLVMSSLLFYHY
jgi:hypothetical protein